MWHKALDSGPLDWRKLKENQETTYKLMFKDEQIGEIVINGDSYENFSGYIKLNEIKEDIEEKTLWFPAYRKGLRIFDNDYLKYFIKNRSSDKTRPQLFHNMKEIGMEKYDRLHLFVYARGQMPTDSLWIAEHNEI